MPVVNCYGDTPWLGNSSPRSLDISPIVCAFVVVIVISGLLVTGIFTLEQSGVASSSGVDVVIQLSGNDVLVTVLDGESARQVTGLHTYINGPPPASAKSMTVRDPPIGTTVVYPGLAKGVIGHESVIVEATFADGTQSIVDYAQMQFS